MTFLQELFSNRYGYEDQEDEDETFPGDDNENPDDEELPDEDEDDSFPGDDEGEDELPDDDELPGDEENPEGDDEGDLFGDEEQDQGDDEEDIEQVVNKATENPNKQGAIRTVPGAHLVYKREQKDGTYEELWMYKNDDMRAALQVRRDIIAGTDIPVNKSTSEDAKQSYTVWTTGNVEMVNIVGLPN